MLLLIEFGICLLITLWPQCMGLDLDETEMVRALQGSYGVPGKEQVREISLKLSRKFELRPLWMFFFSLLQQWILLRLCSSAAPSAVTSTMTLPCGVCRDLVTGNSQYPLHVVLFRIPGIVMRIWVPSQSICPFANLSRGTSIRALGI